MTDLVPASLAQHRFWHWNPAYRVERVHRIEGALDVAALDMAWRAVARRHAVLRTTLTEVDGRLRQVIADDVPGLTVVESGGAEPRPSLDLEDGPVAHPILIRESADRHVLVETQHPASTDRRSAAILTRDLAMAYRTRAELSPLPMTYADYARHERVQSAEGKLLSLPLDRPRPKQPSAPRAARSFSSDEILPASAVFAVFAALLARLEGEDRVVIGVPRARRRFAAVAGFFETPVPVAVDLSGTPTVGEVIAGLRDVDAPLPRLGPGWNTVCSAMFTWTGPRRGLSLPGTRIRTEWHDGPLDVDLCLCLESIRPLAGRLEYSTDLFDAGFAEHLLGQLRTMLAAARPDRPVSGLPLEPPDAVAAFVAERDLRTVGPPVATVPELVGRQASRQPDAEAVDGLTYRALDERAGALAGALHATGLRPGDVVAIRLEPGAEHVTALLGVLKAGCQFVSLSPADPMDRCRKVLHESAARCLLTRDADLVDWGGPVLPPDAGSAPVDLRPELDAPAYTVYTSGSTGTPKAIRQSHRALAQLVSWQGHEFRMGPGRRVAQWASPAYDAAYCEIFATLVSGGALVVVPSPLRLDAGRLLAWLDEFEVSLLQTVPSFARELLHAIETRPPAHLDHLLLAGEPLAGALADGLHRAIPGLRLVNLYGPAEVILATWLDVPAGPATVPVGRPIPGRQVLVLDPAGAACPIGVTGEIVVRGSCVPADVGDGGYWTGDRGRWRWDGLLEFGGRADRQLKVRGTRVEPAEIEAVLAGHPSVRECVVTTIAGQDGLNDALVAYVVPAGESGSPAVWRAHLRAVLAEHLVPSAFVTVGKLTRNAGGKVDLAALPVHSRERFLAWSSSLIEPKE